MQVGKVVLVVLMLYTTGALANDMKMPVNASQIKWAPAPDFIPKGAQIAVLSGESIEGRVVCSSAENTGWI